MNFKNLLIITLLFFISACSKEPCNKCNMVCELCGPPLDKKTADSHKFRLGVEKYFLLKSAYDEPPKKQENIKKCKDYFFVVSHWKEMAEDCKKGVLNNDPLSQVATAIYLLSENNFKPSTEIESLLETAAANNYDDAYYWLGLIQPDTKSAANQFQRAKGTSGLGLLALFSATEIYFNGEGVPKDFAKAQALFSIAIKNYIDLSNKQYREEIEGGRKYFDEKWLSFKSIRNGEISFYAPRYGFKIQEKNSEEYEVIEVEPQPHLTKEELRAISREY